MLCRYYEAPPGLQYLHCLKNTVNGGESLFLDSYKAVSLFKKTYPEDYKVLTKIPVTFHYQNDLRIRKFRHLTIEECPGSDDPLNVYYSPPFAGPLECNPSDMVAFYKGMSKFEEILRDESLLYKRRLHPGDCVIFANRRVLHGRTAFDSKSGERHFRGSYTDWDDFRDLYLTTTMTTSTITIANINANSVE